MHEITRFHELARAFNIFPHNATTTFLHGDHSLQSAMSRVSQEAPLCVFTMQQRHLLEPDYAALCVLLLHKHCHLLQRHRPREYRYVCRCLQISHSCPFVRGVLRHLLLTGATQTPSRVSAMGRVRQSGCARSARRETSDMIASAPCDSLRGPSMLRIEMAMYNVHITHAVRKGLLMQ